MEFPKAYIVGVQPKRGEENVNPNHMVADVVLIDETNGLLNPLLYRLKDHAVDLSEGSVSSIVLHEESLFSVLGAIMHIDKEKKIITLRNRNTIAYKHLILASGNKIGGHPVSQEDFVNGLHALIDALRLRVAFPKSKAGFKFQEHKLSKNNTHFPKLGIKETVSSHSVGRVAMPMMGRDDFIATSLSDLQGIEKPVYIVSLDS